MRIWHQSITVLKNLGAYDDARRDVVAFYGLGKLP